MQTGTGEGGSAPMEREMWGGRVADWAAVQGWTVPPLYKEVLAKTGIGKGTSLLGVGCGAGGFCQMAAERGAGVTGFDATPKMIAMAKSRIPHGDFRTGDMESLPYAGDSFHVVSGFNSFQYAPIR
ncbi:MAG: class I SAM-dependent methyltransferase [Acidobacteriota bacterium]|nr:class I SAM-dependent methyltransferase [Acidobacteriota bacterium]